MSPFNIEGFADSSPKLYRVVCQSKTFIKLLLLNNFSREVKPCLQAFSNFIALLIENALCHLWEYKYFLRWGSSGIKDKDCLLMLPHLFGRLSLSQRGLKRGWASGLRTQTLNFVPPSLRVLASFLIRVINPNRFSRNIFINLEWH